MSKVKTKFRREGGAGLVLPLTEDQIRKHFEDRNKEVRINFKTSRKNLDFPQICRYIRNLRMNVINAPIEVQRRP